METVKFAIIVGNEVAGTVSLPDNPEVEVAQRIIAAYRSNPIILETTEEGIAYGWTWDGTNFNPPSSI